jgi:hypothetical protein
MNRLIINKEKTVAVSFHQPQKVRAKSPQIKMQDTVINYTEHIKFLGLWPDKNIKWSIHTQQLATKLSKICFAIRIITRVSGLETVCTLYCAYFHSLLLYGLIFWRNSANAKLIFRLQKRAIRAMVQIPKNISCKQYFKSLHILPLPSLYIYEILMYIKLIWMSSQQIQKYTSTTQGEKLLVHITIQYESMQKQLQQYWN